MKSPLAILQLRFLPLAPDLGLLLLRVCLGAAMLVLHGWGKLINFSERSSQFADPLGIGSTASLALAVFAEVVAAALVTVGFFTRFAAVTLAVTMAVAFFLAHGGRLSGPGNGEMSFLYLVAFVLLVCIGPGRYSLDARLGGGAAR